MTIKMIKPCINCGAENTSDFEEYDGMLGYECIICKKCGYSYDIYGIHPPEPGTYAARYKNT